MADTGRILDLFDKRAEARAATALLGDAVGANADVLRPAEAPRATYAGPERRQSMRMLAKGISVLVEIVYLGKLKNLEFRRITIRRIYRRNTEYLVDGFCHTVKAPRMFKASRIKQITDLATGMTYYHPVDFLLQQVAFDETVTAPSDPGTAVAIKRLRAELAALVFFARVDGSFERAEMNVIADHIRKRCADLTYDMTKLIAYAGKLYPDKGAYLDSLDDIVDRGPDFDLPGFIETLVRLILIDDDIGTVERNFLSELLGVLEEEGIHVNVGD